MRVYIPLWQRVKVKEAEEFDRVSGVIKDARIYEKELAAEPGRFVTKLSRPTLLALANADGLLNAHAIWSLWAGYLEEPSGEKLKAELAEHDIPLTVVHTSGHAPLSDLMALAKALAPKHVVPIHSFGTDRFNEYFQNVEQHADNEFWVV